MGNIIWRRKNKQKGNSAAIKIKTKVKKIIHLEYIAPLQILNINSSLNLIKGISINHFLIT